jgi:hypothetical protein
VGGQRHGEEPAALSKRHVDGGKNPDTAVRAGEVAGTQPSLLYSGTASGCHGEAGRRQAVR